MMRLLDLEPSIALLPKAGQESFTCVPLSRFLALPWGLESLANPAGPFTLLGAKFTKRRGLVMPTSYGLRRLEDEASMGKPVPLRMSDLKETRWLVLQIDLTWPLETIGEAVMRKIRNERQLRSEAGHIELIEARAQSPARLVEYLRILDARAANVPYARIGEVLHPNQENSPPDYGRDRRMKAAYKKARQMCEGGYSVLPVLKDKLRAQAGTKK
jgi:hypothetical protein